MEDSDDRATDVIAAVGDVEEITATEDKLGPGTEIGGYLIDGELGRGGMGFVYAGTHPMIGKRAAIKVLKPDLSKDPAAVERFKLEARAVNQIGHPNIVDIYDFGFLPDGRCYYVMDLLAGEPLRKRLQRGPLHVSEAANVLDQTASALAAAHDKGIVHRDLKPDNVFMVSLPGRWPEVRLLDWGLAKLLRGGTRFQTVTGSVLGTPVYMSPEQARGDALDHRTDIYALGVMAYELLTGVVPFKGQSSVDTLLAHQEEPVPSLRAAIPTLPEELAQLVEAMLAKTPDERPTLAAIRTVLKRLRGTQIPTMTAAGLQIGPITSEQPAAPAPAGPLSNQVTVPRLPLIAIEPLPPPPAPPYAYPQGSQQIAPAYAPPPYAQPPLYSQPPPSYSQPLPYAQPQFPPAAGLLPHEPASPATSRRWIVIAIVAIVAAAIGVMVAVSW